MALNPRLESYLSDTWKATSKVLIAREWEIRPVGVALITELMKRQGLGTSQLVQISSRPSSMTEGAGSSVAPGHGLLVWLVKLPFHFGPTERSVAFESY